MKPRLHTWCDDGAETPDHSGFSRCHRVDARGEIDGQTRCEQTPDQIDRPEVAKRNPHVCDGRLGAGGKAAGCVRRGFPNPSGAALPPASRPGR
ncbi:hypothetical protein Ga0080559_TMP3130 [Salipiger profundus]|uniref:Uncharacterized protein n=1 Tax=Salipiger profundus TaxID=1229727 RepID=A0A1U7D768_9RHOB|nr:hypothetical protein Ga0080559_TMP3130 [Salipiger profundus]